MFRVRIEEIIKPVDGFPADDVVVVRYEQTVDAIDRMAVINAVNRKPRKPRVRRDASTFHDPLRVG